MPNRQPNPPGRESPEDWDQWARQPMTQAFQRKLQATVEETKEAWARTHFTGETQETTMRLNTVALAGVDVLRQVIDMVEDCKLQEISHE